MSQSEPIGGYPCLGTEFSTSGLEISIKELVELIAKLTVFKGEMIWDNSKPDGQLRPMLDVSRPEREIGFNAKISLEEGLKKQSIGIFQQKKRNRLNKQDEPKNPMVLLRNSWMSPVFTAWVGSIRLPLKMGFVLLTKTF